MHIPDGFFDAKTWVGATALSAATLAYAAKQTKARLHHRQIPFMGVMAAFIFAAQMVNFPVLGGTSGHLIGGVLAAILLGPWSACILMTTVLTIQALLFQDGGITALGGNILNMAIIAPFTGYYIYRLITKISTGKTAATIATFLAAWASVVVAALAASLELAFSGTVPLSVVLPAMVGWHILIGIGEGVITTVVIGFLTASRPDLAVENVKV